MRGSFLGIIRHDRGWELAALVPESGAAREWLQAFTKRTPAACFWAVMDRCVAVDIAELLSEGESALALQRLATNAEHLGPLVANHPDASEATQ